MLDEYDYYWRIEPDVDYYCDIDYDVFKFMRDNNKKYGKSTNKNKIKAQSNKI
jgi:alpha 1,2-mannosyltransferase